MIIMSDTLTFYGNKYCPFVQRSWIVLKEKNIPFDYVEIDLADENKQPLGEKKREIYPWLYDMNPLGTVPVMKHGDKVLYESLVICDYLEDSFSQSPKFFPVDTFKRGQGRLLITHIGNIVPMIYQALGKSGAKEQQESLEALTKKLELLESEMKKASPEGPFMLGSEISMADIAFIPFFARLVILLSHYRQYQVPAKLTRLLTWYETMKKRESYVSTLVPNFEEKVVDVYAFYVKK